MKHSRYDHVVNAVFDTPWFIRETTGAVISALVRARMAGARLGQDEITARLEVARAQNGPREGAQIAGPVAIVPIYGVLMQRANMMTDMSGGTSYQAIQEDLDEVLRDKDIAAVILEFDSPGGEVSGCDELATWMRDQRGTKPMVAVVNTCCCSAAYYLAAQCDEIVATPSSITGSIGIWMEHVEFSKANEMEGVTPTIIRQPVAKYDVNEDEPLSSDAQAHLQMIVDDYYGQFVAAVAKGRGVGTAAVRDGYAQGRELTSGRAKAAGLVDRVDTMDNTVRRLSSGRGRAAMAAAQTSIAVLDSGLPFADRLALVTAETAELVEHATARLDMRAKEGRSLSAADRTGLLAVADSLTTLAAAQVDDEPESSPDVTPSIAWAQAAALRMAIARAEYGLD